MNRERMEVLDAMGITVWVPREAAAAQAAGPVVAPRAAAAVGAGPARAADAPPLSTETSAAATMDWNRLAAAVAACTRCRLHATRTQTVFGVGNRSAAWMIVGEGPGQEEDRRGEPFVGPAGQLLNAMLKAAGHAREDVYIANIVKCRPPNNRNPQPDEAAACADFLARQITLVAPRLIVAVGRVAAQNLLGTDLSLGRLRGRIHRHPATGTAVLVTYHPAYLLRSPADKAKAWQDLKLAMQYTQAPA